MLWHNFINITRGGVLPARNISPEKKKRVFQNPILSFSPAVYIYLSSFYTQIPEFTEIYHLIPFDIHKALYAWKNIVHQWSKHDGFLGAAKIRIEPKAARRGAIPGGTCRIFPNIFDAYRYT